MKKIKLIVALLFAGLFLSGPLEPCFASMLSDRIEALNARKSWYSPSQIAKDFAADTGEAMFKTLNTGFFFDVLESGRDRMKFGVSTTLFAYKFIALEPLFLYTPSNADAVGEFGFAFPIRLGYLPVGAGRKLKDYADFVPETGTIFDVTYIKPFMSHNLSTGRFGFGFSVGMRWG